MNLQGLVETICSVSPLWGEGFVFMAQLFYAISSALIREVFEKI